MDRLPKDLVREAREERGWSQKRLAAEAGVSEGTVTNVELGRRRTQPAKLRAILDALDLAAVEQALDLTDVPIDVAIFLRHAAHRLAALDEDARGRVIADLYGRLLDASASTPVEVALEAYRRGFGSVQDGPEDEQIRRNG